MSESEEMADKESDFYHHEELGTYIESVRISIGISISRLCKECHIGRDYYYRLKRAKI